MTTPLRLQLSRRKGFNLQALSRATNGLPAVKVTRPGKWGNPYKAGLHCDHQHAVDCHSMLVRTGAEAKSAPAVETSPLAYSPLAYYAMICHEVAELRGKNLACWCGPDQPCHADVLLELANPTDDRRPTTDDRRPTTDPSTAP